MKKLIAILSIIILSGISFQANAGNEPFFRPTKNKTVKRMTRTQVRKAQLGYNYYHRVNNKSKRNR